MIHFYQVSNYDLIYKRIKINLTNKKYYSNGKKIYTEEDRERIEKLEQKIDGLMNKLKKERGEGEVEKGQKQEKGGGKEEDFFFCRLNTRSPKDCLLFAGKLQEEMIKGLALDLEENVCSTKNEEMLLMLKTMNKNLKTQDGKSAMIRLLNSERVFTDLLVKKKNKKKKQKKKTKKKV